MTAAAILAAILTVATPAQFKTAVAAHGPGDTVKLAPGAWPEILDVVGSTTPLTIDPAGASIMELAVTNSSGVTVLAGGVYGGGGQPPTVTAYYGVAITGSDHITVGGMSTANIYGSGLNIVKSSFVTATGVRGTQSWGSNEVNIASSHDVTVTNITCQGLPYTTAQHPDCVELSDPVGSAPLYNITINGVAVTGWTQGVDLFTHPGIDIGGTNIVFENIACTLFVPTCAALTNSSGQIAHVRATTPYGAQFEVSSYVSGGTATMVDVVNGAHPPIPPPKTNTAP